MLFCDQIIKIQKESLLEHFDKFLDDKENLKFTFIVKEQANNQELIKKALDLVKEDSGAQSEEKYNVYLIFVIGNILF